MLIELFTFVKLNPNVCGLGWSIIFCTKVYLNVALLGKNIIGANVPMSNTLA